MSFVKNIKDLFIISDEDQNNTSGDNKKTTSDVSKHTTQDKTPNSDVATSATSTSREQTNTAAMEESQTPIEGKVDKRFVDILMNVLSENNLEGYDYFEYKQALRKLRDIEPDEEKRFKSAYFAVQSLGVSPKEFLESGKYYLDLLQKEEGKFKDSLKVQMQSQVYTKQKDLDQFDAWVQQKEEEIKRINQEIEDRRKQNEALTSEIQASQQKIKQVDLNFSKTYNTLVEEINSDLEKIQKYLS